MRRETRGRRNSFLGDPGRVAKSMIFFLLILLSTFELHLFLRMGLWKVSELRDIIVWEDQGQFLMQLLMSELGMQSANQF